MVRDSPKLVRPNSSNSPEPFISLFADRYHTHVLRTPTEVHRALSYVLLNLRKHAAEQGSAQAPRGLDAFSSGPWFGGWHTPPAAAARLRRGEPPVTQPRAWLLREGWMRSQCASCAKLTGPALERDPFVCQKCYRGRQAEASASRRVAVASSTTSQRAS
jgi:hypothetical protein